MENKLRIIKYLFISFGLLFLLNSCTEVDCFNPTIEECEALKDYITRDAWILTLYRYVYHLDGTLKRIDTIPSSEKKYFKDTLDWALTPRIWNLDCHYNKLIFIHFPSPVDDPDGVDYIACKIIKADQNKLWLDSDKYIFPEVITQLIYRFSR